jgi:hypothetical protein
VLTKITQIVHGGLWSAPFSGLELNRQNSASRPGMNMAAENEVFPRSDRPFSAICDTTTPPS